jgi:hypothetical protein
LSYEAPDVAPSGSRIRKYVILLVVFLISLTGLTLQVTLTRIFSVTLFYHYAFVAISIALLGWGLGGLVLYFFKQSHHVIKSNVVLVFLAAYSISMPLYLIAVQQIGFSLDQIILCYALSLIPFFLAGFCMAYFYTALGGTANKVYIADLVGAALGCLLLEPVLNLLGAESTILLLGTIASISLVLVVSLMNKRKLLALSLVFLVFTVSFFAANTQTNFLTVSNSGKKPLFELLKSNSNLSIGFSQWNSFSRVDALEGFEGALQSVIYIDAGASTDLLKWDGKTESLEYLKQTAEYLPYNFEKSIIPSYWFWRRKRRINRVSRQQLKSDCS